MRDYFGLQVITDPSMTEPGEPYTVQRGWRERLFSRPWRPLKATRTVVPQVPSRSCLRAGRFAIMHPEMLKELNNALLISNRSQAKPQGVAVGTQQEQQSQQSAA